jgi:hypothetical protein
MDKAYNEHVVFNQLSRYAEFYENLSLSVSAFITEGVNASRNIDSYVYSSMQGTLESIKEVLSHGRINDAYALLRKYFDSAIINVYSNLYISDHYSIESYETLKVEKINNWLQGKEKIPEYRVMSSYIRSSIKLSGINGLLYKDNRYKELRDRCNDNTHYNFYYNLLLNDNRIYLEGRTKILDRFAIDLENIFILHLAYLFSLNGHYMMSSDYMDSVTCGLIPEENSQYFVAPFIQEIFDNVIKKKRMDLAIEIKKNSSMLIE